MADGNIIAAKGRLAESVRKLCDPQRMIHHHHTITGLSLYAELEANLAGTQGDTRTPAKSLPPIWIDAAMLLNEIDTQTRKWCRDKAKTTTRLHILAESQWRPQDTDKVNTIAHTIDGWCEAIRTMLNPEAKKSITAPCPSCGHTVAYYRDSAGERVRKQALEWTASVGFECRACRAHWGPEQTLFFCKLLGFDLPEGVLE